MSIACFIRRQTFLPDIPFVQDLDTDNILINPADGVRQDVIARQTKHASPFREDFPVRYYINDFELAVCFDEDSHPSTRLVKCLPITGKIEDEYSRDAAPEMLLDAPYCPFRADVWQLGKMFNRTFGGALYLNGVFGSQSFLTKFTIYQHLGDISGPLVELYAQMTNEHPNSRPTASEALESVRRLRSELSPDVLESRVVRPSE